MKYFGVFANGWLQWDQYDNGLGQLCPGRPHLYVSREDALAHMAWEVFDCTKIQVPDTSSEEFWAEYWKQCEGFSVKEVTVSLS